MQDGTISQSMGQELIDLRAEQKRRHTDFQAIQSRNKREEQSFALAKELQKDDEIACSKKRAQEAADTVIAQFCGETVMPLEQRLETLGKLDENDRTHLQTDINLAISLFHDNFVKNKTMVGLDTSAATQSMRSLKDLLKNKGPFSEQVGNIDRVCLLAVYEKEKAQPGPSSQDTIPYYEQDKDNQAGPSSPSMHTPDTNLSTLVETAIHNDDHTLMNDLLVGLPQDTCYNPLRDDLKKAFALPKKARRYTRECEAPNTNTKKPTIQEIPEVNADRTVSSASRPSSSSQPNNSHYYIVTNEQDPELPGVIQEAITSNNHELLLDIVNQLSPNHHLRGAIEYARAVHDQKEFSSNATIQHHSEVWYTHHSSLVKIGTAAAVIGAYFWYKKSH